MAASNNKVPGSAKPKGKPRGGSRKGKPNKISGDVKAMILAALDGAGGVGYLQKQADENPNAFLTLVGKVLPLTLAGDPANPLSITVLTGVPPSDSGAA